MLNFGASKPRVKGGGPGPPGPPWIRACLYCMYAIFTDLLGYFIMEKSDMTKIRTQQKLKLLCPDNIPQQ